jgi:hypothetical protein
MRHPTAAPTAIPKIQAVFVRVELVDLRINVNVATTIALTMPEAATAFRNTTGSGM